MEPQRPDIIRRAIRSFYDERKGGVQYDGIIGTVIGAFCAFKLVGNTIGTFQGLLSLLVLTGLGTYAGNLVGDWWEQRNGPSVASGSDPSPTPQRGQAKQHETGMPDQFVPPPTPTVPDRTQTVARK